MLELNDLITQKRYSVDGIVEKIRHIGHDAHYTMVSLHQSDVEAFFPTQMEEKEGYAELQATSGFWVKSLEILAGDKKYNLYLISNQDTKPDLYCSDRANSYIFKESPWKR